MPARAARWIGGALAAVIVVVSWVHSGLLLGSSVLDLAAFVAPGAVLGLATTWAAYLFRPERFTWRAGYVGAAVGAVALPPYLGSVTVLSATAGGSALAAVFGTWIALGVGFAAALAWRAIAQLRHHEADAPAREGGAEPERRERTGWRARPR